MEDKPEETVKSTQKQLQANHDSGWNDPPKWAYSQTPNTTGNTPTKRLLNKRVAFPLSSTSLPASQAQPTPSVNLPPPPVQTSSLTSAPHAPLLQPSRAETKTLPDDELQMSEEEALENTLENFQAVMSGELREHCKLDGVERRLEIMKTMWKEGKFTSEIHRKVLEISKALLRNDVEAADSVHVSLMINHAALCTSWISAVRQMIVLLKEKSI